jgi:hypothetical protein
MQTVLDKRAEDEDQVVRYQLGIGRHDAHKLEVLMWESPYIVRQLKLLRPAVMIRR